MVFNTPTRWQLVWETRFKLLLVLAVHIIYVVVVILPQNNNIKIKKKL